MTPATRWFPGALLAAAGAFVLMTGTARPAWATVQDSPREIELRAVAPDGVVLAGTLYTPGGAGPYVTLLLVHGSERGGRHQPGYQRWATTLVASGFACLVVDKRGVGASGGEYVEAPRIDAAAGDVLAWLKVLSGQKAVRQDAIGLLGWSQAGWVAPLAASDSPNVAFLVLISGPGVSPLEQNIYDKTNRVLSPELTDEQAAETRTAVRTVMTYLVTGEDREAAAEAWNRVKDEPWFADKYTGIPFMDREVLLSDPRGVGFVEHNAYDPAPALAALHIPVLALFGRADRIVPVPESQVAMRTAIAPDAQLEMHVFDGANHSLGLTADDGSVRLHPEVYPLIIAWIRSVTGTP